MAKIYLSPSNQNGNLYEYGNTNEMEQCNRIADAAKTALERCGFTVKKAPKGQAMSTTISESNSWKPDLHMCIHTNAGGGSGTMCMVYSKAAENMKYATPIYNAVQAVTPGKTNYGVREMPELAELNGTSCIAVYTEVDFHDNAAIAKWLIENPQTVGEAFAKGVCQAFGVAYKATTTTSTNTSSAANTTSDLTKFINQAKTYIGKNGSYVCNTKLKLGTVYDWCAYAVSAIMNDLGFIGKYIKQIEGGAGSIPRESDSKYGTFFIKGTKAPQTGDLILFRYNSTGYTDKYHSDHIGIVESVNGNTITTLEGNVEGNNNSWAATSTFKRKTRNLSDSSTYAFYRPNWAGTTKSNQTLYRVQVGAFADKNNAEAYLKKIQAAGYKDAFITTNNK